MQFKNSWILMLVLCLSGTGFFSVQAKSEPGSSSVDVSFAGALVRNSTGKYYYKTNGQTTVSYSNPLLADDAQVAVDFHYTASVLRSDNIEEQKSHYQPGIHRMKNVAPRIWQLQLPATLHGRGGRFMISGAHFAIHVQVPNRPTTLVTCAEGKRYYISYPDFSTLPWQNDDQSMPPDLKVELKCVKFS